MTLSQLIAECLFSLVRDVVSPPHPLQAFCYNSHRWRDFYSLKGEHSRNEGETMDIGALVARSYDRPVSAQSGTGGREGGTIASDRFKADRRAPLLPLSIALDRHVRHAR